MCTVRPSAFDLYINVSVRPTLTHTTHILHVVHECADRKDKDPLGNRDILLHDIISVGRDGVGGAMAKRHGCMYRIEVRD